MATATLGPGASSVTVTSGVASNNPGRVMTVLLLLDGSWLPQNRPLQQQVQQNARIKLSACKGIYSDVSAVNVSAHAHLIRGSKEGMTAGEQ